MDARGPPSAPPPCHRRWSFTTAPVCRSRFRHRRLLCGQVATGCAWPSCHRPSMWAWPLLPRALPHHRRSATGRHQPAPRHLHRPLLYSALRKEKRELHAWIGRRAGVKWKAWDSVQCVIRTDLLDLIKVSCRGLGANVFFLFLFFYALIG
jgi:hypothetical protein